MWKTLPASCLLGVFRMNTVACVGHKQVLRGLPSLGAAWRFRSLQGCGGAGLQLPSPLELTSSCLSSLPLAN